VQPVNPHCQWTSMVNWNPLLVCRRLRLFEFSSALPELPSCY
jgi:hypothetical protein